MTEGTGYNGWSNYETWCVSLWLSNDEGTYSATRELARAASEESNPSSFLRDMLVDYVEELPEMTAVTEGPASFVLDLLGAAMAEVNFREIAENLLSEIAE